MDRTPAVIGARIGVSQAVMPETMSDFHKGKVRGKSPRSMGLKCRSMARPMLRRDSVTITANKQEN